MSGRIRVRVVLLSMDTTTTLLALLTPLLLLAFALRNQKQLKADLAKGKELADTVARIDAIRNRRNAA